MSAVSTGIPGANVSSKDNKEEPVLIPVIDVPAPDRGVASSSANKSSKGSFGLALASGVRPLVEKPILCERCECSEGSLEEGERAVEGGETLECASAAIGFGFAVELPPA